jgi:UDP-N-acetylglucosamine 2-epimerase (non-hydrolysing)
MQKNRPLIVIGTRPEAIKLAPLYLALRERGHKPQVLFTGQHPDIVATILDFFRVPIWRTLDVMRPGQSLASLSVRILQEFESQKTELSKFGSFFVQGDTTTAFLGAYWAFLNHIPVVHVEAGLRTYNLKAPFPEEANRQLMSRITDLHFAPTQAARNDLLSEGVSPRRIHVVGNTGIDACQFVLDRQMRPKVHQGDSDYFVVTAHRRENFGDRLVQIAIAVRQILDSHVGMRAVIPMHPNPEARGTWMKAFSQDPRVELTEPLDFVPFLKLCGGARVILSDSGGIQEEAGSLRVPVLVLRDETERPEAVAAGFCRIVGANPKKILSGFRRAIKHGSEGRGGNPYGRGDSALRITKICEKSLF